MEDKIVLTKDTPDEVYDELYQRPEGEVFKVDNDNCEAILDRIEQRKPSGKEFMVFPIDPGTSLYTLYGANHYIVVKNEPISG